MTIPVLFTFDDNLVMPAGVCITSLLENANPDTFYDIFVMHSSRYDFSKTLLVTIPEVYGNCSITFIPISGVFEGGYEVRGITETCYYRLLASEYITEYDKIYYSDVDVVFRSDIADVFNVDMGDRLVAGVDNCCGMFPEFQHYMVEQLGIDWHDGYCNSGELLLNLELMREEGTAEKFKALSHRKFKFQDQDMLNIVCNKRIKFLPISYNLTLNLYDLILHERVKMLDYYSEKDLCDALEKGTVHYTGEKPWKGWCYNLDIWWSYYRRSVFFNESQNYDMYDQKVNMFENWSLLKRLKHVARFFID